MKTKTQSKYIDQKTLKHTYEQLSKIDKAVFTILYKTGIRIGEFKQYVDSIYNKIISTGMPEYIDLTPQKKNNKRLLPIVISEYQVIALQDISLEKKALQKRIAKWDIGFSAHDFRATFITLALEKEINPIKLMTITGHKEMKSLLKYNRLSTENSLWMYDYITQDDYGQWTKLDEVSSLKALAASQAKELAKLKHLNDKLAKGKKGFWHGRKR